MSPSRIPRPQGSQAPPSPLGPNAEVFRTQTQSVGSPKGNPTNPSIQNALTGSPKTIQAGAFNHASHPHGSVFQKPNSGFIQPRSYPSPNHSPNSNATLSPPSVSNGRLQPRSRRPKPPHADEEIMGHSSSPQQRRNIPTSPETNSSGIPRPSRGVGSPTTTNGNNARSCLRQPSVPALSAPKDQSIKPRSRSTSAAADTRPNIPQTKDNPPPMPLFAPSFEGSREPSVPPHICIRLRLIHQLGVVLGIDAQGISSKIDVPGLLARVDAAYDRGYQGKMDRGYTGSSMISTTSISSISGLPMPNRGRTESQLGPNSNIHNLNKTPDKEREREKEKEKERGMFGMFKRFGKERHGKEEERVPLTLHSQTSEGRLCTYPVLSLLTLGPAFGVSLNDAPPGSWCTSLIGGQRHEIPLVVFSIVEEIYRRGRFLGGSCVLCTVVTCPLE